MQSVWSEHTKLPGFSPLTGDLTTDVLIIGGGMAGLLCARALRQRGVSYALLEAKTICGGVTQNTTAKITAQHGLLYAKLLRRLGPELAGLYLRSNEQAVRDYHALCQTIKCDFSERDAYVYSLDDRKKLEREAQALSQLGADATLLDATALPFPVAGAIRFPAQGQFHPLKFAAAIAADLNIYEHTPVTELRGTQAVANGHTVRAERIIVATHFPFLNTHGAYFLKLYQHRSYVLALDHAPDLGGMYVDEAQNGMSFRNHKNHLLLGGGDHRTGKQGGNWAELRQAAARFFPEARETGCWATQDCMPLDDVPYIGRYSRRTPHLYVATGFHKWGMTSSMVAANLLADLVTDRENPAARLYDPSRSIWTPQLAVNGFEAVTNLLTPTAPRCPHLGCALKWNRTERSWDCPCHGSRFQRNGKLLDNPATGDLHAKSRKRPATGTDASEPQP